MKIGILTAVSQSSRGDVEPYVALAKAFQRRGHQPQLLCEDKFEPFVRSQGVACVPVAGPKPPDESKGRIRAQLRQGEWLDRHIEIQLASALDAFRDADALTSSESMLSFVTAYDLAEKLKVPYLPTFFSPEGITGAFPCPLMARFWSKRPGLNRATYRLAARMVRALVWYPMKKARKAILGLPARDRHDRGFFEALFAGLPVLYGYSPSFLPKPQDWPESAHVTGYWFLERPAGPPSVDIAHFVQDGEPPVCIALGRGLEIGVKLFGAERFWTLILEAVERSGRRGIIITAGYPPPAVVRVPSGVFMAEAVPYRWLFPRVSAVVHHAGAGTTGWVLRAGVPSVPVPAAWDQLFWSRQLERVGAGTAPIPVKQLDSSRLAALIGCAASDSRMVRRAKELSGEIEAEDGPGEAVRLAETYFAKG